MWQSKITDARLVLERDDVPQVLAAIEFAIGRVISDVVRAASHLLI